MAGEMSDRMRKKHRMKRDKKFPPHETVEYTPNMLWDFAQEVFFGDRKPFKTKVTVSHDKRGATIIEGLSIGEIMPTTKGDIKRAAKMARAYDFKTYGIRASKTCRLSCTSRG